VQCIVTFAIEMYFYLPKTTSEIQIFNFGYLSSRLSTFAWARIEDPWLFFEARRGPRAKS